MRGRGYLRLTGAVLLAAMTAYAAASLSDTKPGTPETVTLSCVTVSESISAEGIIVRREICIPAREGFYTVAADRSRVSGGSVIAADAAALRAMDSELRAERLGLAQTLSGKELYSARDELENAEDTVTRKNAEAVIAAILGFSPGEAEPDEPCEEGGEYILAPCAGTFYKHTDGYEGISSSELCEITVSGLRKCINSCPDKTKRSLGRLLPSGAFRFAALIAESDVPLIGDEPRLDFGTGEQYPASLSYLSAPEGGLCAAVFRCDADSTETSDLRLVSAKIISRSFTGLRIPREAISSDAGGAHVSVILPTGETELPADIIYENDEFCLAAVTESLREGMSVILKK